MATRDEWDEADARGEIAPPSGFARSVDGTWHPLTKGNGATPELIREQLLAHAARLGLELATIDRLTGPPAEGARPQYGKRIGDHTSDAVEMRRNVAAGDVLRDLRQNVERALRKLENGTYGACDVCAHAITDERLEALPWAATCLDCRSTVPPGSR